MPRGVPQIEVTYDVDANGILNVSAAEKSTGKSQKITITNEKGRLSKDDIERMVSDAEKLAEEDKKAMERVEAKNELESYLYNARNSFREEKVKEKMVSEDLEKVEALLKENIDWLDANPDADKDTFKAQYKAAEEAVRPYMIKMYGAKDMSSAGSGTMSPEMEAAAAAAAAAAGPGPGPKVEEVD
jgi:L1 cell adhesion molecule like protein